MPLAPTDPSKQPEQTSARTVLNRVVDMAKAVITVTDHLKILEKEDARIQSQIIELTRYVTDLAKEVRELSGQMKGIEKRLEDKDKLIEATIKLRIIEEIKIIEEINKRLPR